MLIDGLPSVSPATERAPECNPSRTADVQRDLEGRESPDLGACTQTVKATVFNFGGQKRGDLDDCAEKAERVRLPRGA